MVSGAKKCSCTELTGKILSWPNVIQIFIRLDNLVKKIQMEEGRSIFFFRAPFPFANDKNYKKWCRMISDTHPPDHQNQEWAPWRISWPRSILHTLEEILRHFGIAMTLVFAPWVPFGSRTKHCCGRSNPTTRVTARWHGRVSEGVKWDWERTAEKESKCHEYALRSLPYLILPTAIG